MNTHTVLVALLVTKNSQLSMGQIRDVARKMWHSQASKESHLPVALLNVFGYPRSARDDLRKEPEETTLNWYDRMVGWFINGTTD
jgi:hypothetical protein